MTDDLKAQVVRGVGWSALQSWGMRLISFLVYPILARILGPETYGLIALAGVYITLLDVFSDVSFGAAIEQRRELDPEHLDSVFWAFLALGVALTGGSMLAAPLVAGFFSEPQLESVVRWLSLGFLMQMVSGVQTSLLRRELQMRRLARCNLASTAVGSICGVTMALTGFGVWSVVAQRLLTRSVHLSMLWASSTWRPRLRFSSGHLRQMAGFGLSIMAMRVVEYLNRRIDQILIGRSLGKVELGLYFNATKLQMLATNMLVGGYSQLTMPAMSRLQNDAARFQRAYAKACRFVTTISFPVFLGLSVLAEELVLTVLGPDWQLSAEALRLLALAGVIHSLQYFNDAAMLALGRADLKLKLQILHTAVNISGFFIAVRYGFVAVAAAYTIRAYLLAPVDFWVSHRIGAFRPRLVARAIGSQLVASIGMYVALGVLRNTVIASQGPTSMIAISAACGALVYAAILAILDRGIFRELLDLARTARPAARSGPPGDGEE